MTSPIHIEPDGPRRPAFAAWGLAQNPPLQTASASGWDVPLELYPDVPSELLEGAYVDGFLYGRPDAPQPAPKASVQPRGEEVPVEVQDAGPVRLPVRKPRKRAAGDRKSTPVQDNGYTVAERFGGEG